MQQALDYARDPAAPVRVLLERRRLRLPRPAPLTSRRLETNAVARRVPLARELWARYREWKGLPPETESLVLQDYYSDGSGKGPRYYQATAVNAAVEAVAKGQNRLLLVMATGTGKTYTAFQIIWRLWKAGAKKRVLFLADRNILADQTMVNDFRPFGSAMAKLSTSSKVIEREDGTKSICRSRSTRSGGSTSRTRSTCALPGHHRARRAAEAVSRSCLADFFDLIVVDECHRGSAAEDSAWREILELLLVGDADRHDGDAEGDEVRLEHPLLRRADLHATRSSRASRTASSRPTRSSRSTSTGTSRAIGRSRASSTTRATRSRTGSTTRRTSTARSSSTSARSSSRRRSPTSCKETDRFQKTIVFCVDTEHAARMRQALVNENSRPLRATTHAT